MITPGVIMDRREELVKLWDQICACQKCSKIVPHIKNRVFGEGNVSSPIVLVGEAPGEEEDLTARPFVGAAGKVLGEILDIARIQRERIMIINALKCRPTKGVKHADNRTPSWEEIQSCQPFLKGQLDVLQPKIIVAMGKIAVSALLSKPPDSFALKDYAGMAQRGEKAWCLPTYHPAYVAHRGNDPRLIEKIAGHITRAKEMLNE